MRVGVVTIYDKNNYGNRLQNYAVCKIVKSYGYIVDTIVIHIKDGNLYSNKCNFKQKIKQKLPCNFVLRIIGLKILIKRCLMRDVIAKRIYIFSKFTDSYLAEKIFYVDKYEDIYNINAFKQYDYFLAGSDQVWNPFFAGDDHYFLTFTPPEKRVGFIASIGVLELPEEQKCRYATYLKQMKYISVREEAAVELIENLIHKKVDCFLDPVLLLGREEWENLIKSVRLRVPDRYILSFFLGKEPKEKIAIFADSKNIKVIHMNQKEYSNYYALGPEQLLYLIRNAEYILTDSFHVTAFSIIFQKQFTVFHREQEGLKDMFSRMETLLGRLGLMGRIHGSSSIEEIDDISDAQYQNIVQILIAERSRLDETMKMVLRK